MRGEECCDRAKYNSTNMGSIALSVNDLFKVFLLLQTMTFSRFLYVKLSHLVKVHIT